MNRVALAAALALAAATGLSACAEKPQVAGGGASRAQADAKPWQAERGAHTVGQWDKGDRKGWETALRTRAQGQNEYVRTR
jgi:hypothetical protein